MFNEHSGTLILHLLDIILRLMVKLAFPLTLMWLKSDGDFLMSLPWFSLYLLLS